MQERAGNRHVAVDARERPGDEPHGLGDGQAVLEQPVAVGLVVVLRRRRVAVAGPDLGALAEQPVEQLAQVRVLDRREQVAQVGLHRLGAARRPVEQVVGVVLRGARGAQRTDRHLRAVARVDRVAAGDMDGAAGGAVGREIARALPGDGGEHARAVAQLEAQVLAPVAALAQLGFAHHEHLLDVLAVDELPDEHGGDDRDGCGSIVYVCGEMSQSALITGGTGGLGSAVVGSFLEAGWRVVVPWVVEAELERVEQHDRLVLMQADLFDPDSVETVVSAAVGPPEAPLKAVVNLVGGFSAPGRVHEAPSRTSSASSRSTSSPPTSSSRPRSRT